MIRRIVLNNYMSHAQTVIEPAAGLTIICGPNNCGKSAIASALQTLCGNHDGDFMVRHGEKLCSVTVETDDGHTIAWRRKGGKVAWVINGTEVNRASKANLPDNLQPLLRLPRVQHPNKNEEFDVHFGDQKSPLFLIDKESDAAAFFSTASDAEKFLEMQKLHKQRVTDRKRLHSQTVDELARCDLELAALAPLEQVNVELEKAGSRRQEIENDVAIQLGLELLIKQIGDQLSLISYRQAQARAAHALTPPPALADESPLEGLVGRLDQTVRRTVACGQQKQALHPLTEPPVLEDEASLLNMGKRLSEQTKLAGRLDALTTALTALADVPAVQDPAPLAVLVERLHKSHAVASAAQRRHDALRGLGEAPAQLEESPMVDLLNRLNSASGAAAKLRADSAELDLELRALDEQITQWLWANPTCPTCGAVTSREHLLQEAKGGVHG